MLKYAILGPVELYDGERGVSIGGSRQLALLALLLVNANRVLSTDRLVEALWDDLDRSRALRRLRVTVARLRRALDRDVNHGESVLRTVAGGYLLAVTPGELDAEVFQTRVQEGRRALEGGDAQRARDVLGEALRMWRGPALAQVADEEFAQPEIRRLEELRLSAFEAWVDCQLQLGDHDAVIGELEALVAVHPGRERLAGQLMLALYRSGRQGDALEVYMRTRAYLSGELGLEPGPALQSLQMEILAQSATLQPESGGTVVAGIANAGVQPDLLPTGVVTFVLTDVEGSTALWEADPDAMATALEHHDQLIATLVERHQGQLLKKQGEGDATLSVFERASDAVACAAEIQRGLAHISDTGELELRVRVALHSGEAHERDGDYFGPVLNRAARLRSLAAGGVTVVSKSTAELVRDRLPREQQLVDLGRHELRGMSRAERVFELRARADASASSGVGVGPVVLELPRSLHRPAARSPFVGRDVELAFLRERWTKIRGGSRSAVVIGGEPGIGKTRLTSEFAHAVHREGALVLYGHCDEGLAMPYQPFVEALRPYARAAGVERICTRLGAAVCELVRLLPEFAGLGEPVRGDPESARFALFEAVAGLIEAITREQPALLILDDLHWAAPPTLLLLRHLIRSEGRLGLMVLCTYRDTEVEAGQPLAQLLADLHRDQSAERLSIRGLDEPAIAALLRVTVGHPFDEHSSELVRKLEVQTAGNPFFIRELLAHMVQAGTIPAGDEHRATDVTARQLQAPEGLRQVITQRVARLSAPTGRALRAAAVAGPTFSFVLLERVLGDECSVLDALDEAVAAGLLAEAGDGDYVFAHTLVRETIYQELSAARRMRLHRQLGEALEALGDSESTIEALASHFAMAAADGQAIKAIDYALAAGRNAIARLGYEDAAAHYERGLQALTHAREPQEQRRCELLLALGEARWGAGELDKARHAYGQAAELADKLDDSASLVRAALGFCGPHRFEVAVTVTRPVADLLQRALASLGEDDNALRAQLMGRLAAALAYAGVEHDAPVLARQALEMARQVGDKATLADVLASTLWVIRGPDALHESLTWTMELGRLADELRDNTLQALARGWLLDLLLEKGDIDAVQRELEALQQLATTRRERQVTWLLTVIRANHALLDGRLDDFQALAHDGLAYRFDGNDETAVRIFEGQMLTAHILQGRLDELLGSVESSAEQYSQLPAWRCALASVYAQLGHRAQARHELEALARDDFSDLPRGDGWLMSLSMLSGVVAFLDDAPRAQLLYDLLLPYSDRCVVGLATFCLGSVSHPLGLLATTMSRYDAAECHFERAIKMNAQIRSPLWIAYTQLDYAHMLLLRDHCGDREKALDLLGKALATAEKLGLTALADKTRPLKLAAETAGASGDGIWILAPHAV
ncbi:MAG TPA: BTAD domain-containing putative transcriptional regulator [Solirubrobacteraceae bacterium]